MMCIINKLRNLVADKKAVVSLEFSLLLPALLMLLFGSIEITNAIYARQKGVSVANIAQDILITENTLDKVVASKSDLGNVLKKIMGSFAKDNQMGFVYTLIDKAARISDTDVKDDDDKLLYVAYQTKFGDTTMITQRLQYNPTLGQPVNKKYFDNNKIANTDIVHQDIASFSGGVLNTDTTEQYVVIEAAMTYQPIFRVTGYIPIKSVLKFRFETLARNLDTVRYGELPDGRNLN